MHISGHFRVSVFCLISAAVICAGEDADSQSPSVRFEPCAVLSAVSSTEQVHHPASYAADARDDTWWSPAQGRSAGEWILVDFSRQEKVAAVEIVNGAGGRDSSHRPLFSQMGRIVKGEAELSNGVRVPFELADSPAPQRIILPASEVRWVKIIIISSRRGTASNDVCLSRISILKTVPIYFL
ncbi:MAG: discoidin domain-containing protein [Spirochaetota bacterium]